MREHSFLVALVDDDPSVRKALVRLLRANGYDVGAYESAQEFLDALKIRSPDCVLLDVHMQPLGGLELQLELNLRSISIPVIFISAVDDGATRERALSQGAVAYLQKPPTEEALFSALGRIHPTKH